jgi:hypothetical protein
VPVSPEELIFFGNVDDIVKEIDCALNEIKKAKVQPVLISTQTHEVGYRISVECKIRDRDQTTIRKLYTDCGWDRIGFGPYTNGYTQILLIC